jgi:hypothetical protein
MLSNKQKGLIIATGVATLLPIWRSGGRDHLTFWGWIWNHSIWGPPIEYVPEEDYESAICAKNITRRVRE